VESRGSWSCCETGEGDEQEMLRLHDNTAPIPLVSRWILTLGSSRVLTLIEGEDDTRSWSNFLGLFLTQCHTNLRGWGYILIGC
jgi:hypothetical protein